MRKYYAANRAERRRYYQENRETRQAYDRMYRDLNKEAIALREKLYNETRRKKD